MLPYQSRMNTQKVNTKPFVSFAPRNIFRRIYENVIKMDEEFVRYTNAFVHSTKISFWFRTMNQLNIFFSEWKFLIILSVESRAMIGGFSLWVKKSNQVSVSVWLSKGDFYENMEYSIIIRQVSINNIRTRVWSFFFSL